MAEDGLTYKYKNKYSLEHDLKGGWVPKQPFPGPIPLTFQNQSVQLLVKELTDLLDPDQAQKKERVVYLGWHPQNTFEVHKVFSPHGYEFLHFHLLKSRVLSDFFKMHYPEFNFGKSRIFTGMNPTMLGQNIQFDSVFQSGNLDVAIKTAELNYDIYLRVDSNTRGYQTYFYFKVTARKSAKVKFNIMNFSRASSLYNSGMKPYISTKRNPGWTQTHHSFTCTVSNRLARLSFEHHFEDSDEVSFSYCPPYTYSNLVKDISIWQTLNKTQTIIQVSKLCYSLSGVTVPLLTVGKFDGALNKKCVILTARVHPGQSNSSYMMKGFIDWITSNRKEACKLRQTVVFKIVPMLNPDGVIMGNSRTGTSGKDLNREFETSNKFLNPEVFAVRDLVKNCKLIYNGQVLAFIDMHGHSVRKNVFIYGPEFSISDLSYQRVRIIPHILDKLTGMFRYYSCAFKIPVHKLTTARAVIFNRFNIGNTYTIECSVDSYFDKNMRVKIAFKPQLWVQMGMKLCQAIFESNQLSLKRQQYIRRRLEALKTKNQSVQSKPQRGAVPKRREKKSVAVRVQGIEEWEIKEESDFQDIQIDNAESFQNSPVSAEEAELIFYQQNMAPLEDCRNEEEKEDDMLDFDSDSNTSDQAMPREQTRKLNEGMKQAIKDLLNPLKAKIVIKKVEKQSPIRKLEKPKGRNRFNSQLKLTESHKLKIIKKDSKNNQGLYQQPQSRLRTGQIIYTRYFNSQIGGSRRSSISYNSEPIQSVQLLNSQKQLMPESNMFFTRRQIFIGNNIYQFFKKRQSNIEQSRRSNYQPLRTHKIQPKYQHPQLKLHLTRKKSIKHYVSHSPPKDSPVLLKSLPKFKDLNKILAL